MKEFRTGKITRQLGKQFPKEEILRDYYLAVLSREISMMGRREVLTGKAKFGIFGDGKEVPQLAMAHEFKEGDWRSGYYRDQTFMMAAGIFTPEEFFAQLFGDTDLRANPGNGGRLMNNHFASRSLDDHGEWKDLTRQKNSSADISPTAGQMPRLVGLGLASRLFRTDPNLAAYEKFSNQGNEVAFGTIGDASTSEGAFWESMNAVGVLQVPVAVSVWDDDWGISVSKKYQTTKGSISKLLEGFQTEPGNPGIMLYTAHAWDYPALRAMYREGIMLCRNEHVPVLFHVTEVTQPQGHSTSGSHERYKSAERLEWEREHDCNLRFRDYILKAGIADEGEVAEVEKSARNRARDARKKAWKNFQEPIETERSEFLNMVDVTTCNCAKTKKIETIKHELSRLSDPIRRDVVSAAKKILRLICDQCSNPANSLKTNVSKWLELALSDNRERYSSHLHSESRHSAMHIEGIPPQYSDDAPYVPGREILRDNFDNLFSQNPLILAFGEDVGKIGGVNQTMEGLQEKYGEHRVSDTGIREATIIGQGIGLAMRGLRPIAEIQYFDYLLYGLQVLSDDLATLQYRTKGGQKAPLIVSTRGHRLEGIWHSGSPLSMVINSIRGVHVIVPRNMTQAAGFYNTMLASDEPALIIEPLNGYRLREKRPSNIGEYKIPLGVPEVLMKGEDLTLLTYGSCVRIAEDAVQQLSEFDISVELIDIQTLLPFDRYGLIIASLKKTNKIIFFDEDVPGGATSYMMQKVLEEQGGYHYLDAEPRTVTAKDHRAAYSSDGDYFSNPNAEDVFDAAYNMMHEYNPVKYPKIF